MRANKITILTAALGLLIAGWFVFGGNGNKNSEVSNQATSSLEGLQQTKPEATVQEPSNQSTLAEINAFLIDDDVVLGDPNAPVTIVEFGDYQCTFCTKFFKETKPLIEEEYIKTGKVRLVFRDLAINGTESVNAAEASGCATEQGKFWEYHNKLYEQRRGYNVGAFKKDRLVNYAKEIGLNEAEFRTCYEEGRYSGEVQKDTLDAQRLGLRGTPSFVVNGELLSGAQPFSVFQQFIEASLTNINP